jgi:hypothetical protein
MNKDIKESPKSNVSCCGPAANEKINYRSAPAVGRIDTPAGKIAVVSTEWLFRDYLGALGVRVGIHRMDYAVEPGLYAIGSPDKGSPVMVSANYKLSFDILRRELAGLNVWVMVIDTKGVNVWCAAGKGTFGTLEIAKRVVLTGLANIVSHRKLIVPQLGAPGVEAHIVKAFCEFSVSYGPVRAGDIKKYLANGMKADPVMRQVTFGLLDRLDVAWLELTMTFKVALAASVAFFILMSLGLDKFSMAAAWNRSSIFIALFVAGIFSGTLLTAALLPFLPGKAFSLKGGVAGALVALVLLASRTVRGSLAFSVPLMFSALLFVSAISAYLALNYTGSSTYTSLSGVKKEIKFALPAIIGMGFLSGLFQIIGRI